MVRSGFASSLFVTLAVALSSAPFVWAQGQALPPIKVNLPNSPNFDVAVAPVQYPTGEMSVHGLRKGMTKNLGNDFRVKAYLLEIYECPEEIRKCNEAAAVKAKNDKKKAKKAKPAEAAAPGNPDPSECRLCDQPHFLIADTPTTKKERALLVADYPVKDWKTGKPKPLVAKVGEQYIVTGTFAINSITGFAASNGLIIHKKFEDLQGGLIAEGNSVLPPEAQMEGTAVKAPPAGARR